MKYLICFSADNICSYQLIFENRNIIFHFKKSSNEFKMSFKNSFTNIVFAVFFAIFIYWIYDRKLIQILMSWNIF